MLMACYDSTSIPATCALCSTYSSVPAIARDLFVTVVTPFSLWLMELYEVCGATRSSSSSIRELFVCGV